MNQIPVDDIGFDAEFLDGRTNYNRIGDAIRNAIFSRKLAPGARLKVQDLAQQFSVSPIPIREALQQLQGEGLIVIAPNRGATVRKIDGTLIDNIFDIREAIDGMLARKSAPIISDEQVDQLRRIEDDIDMAVKVGELEKAGELGRSFHEFIGRVANNFEAVKIRRAHANVFRSVKAAMGPERIREANRRTEHLSIIEALASRDPIAAEAAAKTHAQAWRQSVLRHFDANATFPLG